MSLLFNAMNRFEMNPRLAPVVAIIFLSSCIPAEVFEKNEQVLKQQAEQIAEQRKEIETIEAEKARDQQQRDCNRAFREYFDKAQTTADREQAVTLYRDGLALCPDDEIARYELGRALADRGRYAEAEKEFEAALKLNPGFIEAQRELDAARQRK